MGIEPIKDPLKEVKSKELLFTEQEQNLSEQELFINSVLKLLETLSSVMKGQEISLSHLSQFAQKRADIASAVKEEFHAKIEEMKKLEKEQEALGPFKAIVQVLSAFLGAVLAAVTGGTMGVLLFAAIFALTSPIPGQDGSPVSMLAEAIGGPQAVQMFVKVFLIVGLTVAASALSGGANAANQASTATSQGLGGKLQNLLQKATDGFKNLKMTPAGGMAFISTTMALNPIADMAMIGADPDDKERQKIAQAVSLSINILLSVLIAFKSFKNSSISASDLTPSGSSAIPLIQKALIFSDAFVRLTSAGISTKEALVMLSEADVIETLAVIRAKMAQLKFDDQMLQSSQDQLLELLGSTADTLSNAIDSSKSHGMIWNDLLRAIG